WLAHYNNTWSDWAFHASAATGFAYGQNLPPQNPLFAGTLFRYPFAPDFASALLIGGGWGIPAALIWPSWAMTVLALSGLILCAAIVMAVLLLLTPLLQLTPFFDWGPTLTTIRRSWRRWALKSEAVAFIVAGALAGLLPLFHIHSLVVIGLVAGCWALLFPRP